MSQLCPIQVTAAKRSRLSARGMPSVGKVVKIVKRDYYYSGQRREESGGRRDGDQAKSGPGVERIDYRWVRLIMCPDDDGQLVSQ